MFPCVLAGGGGVVAAANPLAVVESDTVRVSVLPVVGSELPAFCVGNGALDLVGLRVGPSCLRMDSEETLPALQDERSVMSFFFVIGLYMHVYLCLYRYICIDRCICIYLCKCAITE